MTDQPPPPPTVTNQPGMIVGDPNTGKWSSGVFDCRDDTKICCLGFWCGPCLACKVSKVYGECLCLPLLNVLSGGFPLTIVTIRSSMRERYRIQGSICEDFMLVASCTPCVLCQLAREMKLHNPESF